MPNVVNDRFNEQSKGKKSMTGKGDEFLSIKAFLKVNDKKRQKKYKERMTKKKESTSRFP